ncbi:MAG: imelysin family protein [Polaribacter sp.]
MKRVFKISLLLCAIILVKSCSKDDNPINPKNLIESKKTEFVSNYANIVLASYQDAMQKATDLKTAVDAFVTTPSATTLQAAKDAWLASREPYGQTEAYRFYNGPIDGGADGEPEGSINAWPLDEGLIDYVAAGTSGGARDIIEDTSFELTKESIQSLNGDGGETNVSIGYHAIEFLLWGQDNTPPVAKMSGQRPFTDYTTDANATRRGKYLKLATDLLVDDLKSVTDQWKAGAAYRTSFLSMPTDDAINLILTGAATLSKGELAGERMTVAVENQSQEDEHSCFSDNTHRDIFLNAKSINNIITGTYKKVDGTTVSGTSLLDVLTLVNAKESITLAATATEAMAKVTVISKAKPFDLLLIGETVDNDKKPIMSAVLTLRKQGDLLAQSGKTITGKTIDLGV